MHKIIVSLFLIAVCMSFSLTLSGHPVNLEDLSFGLYPMHQLVEDRPATKDEMKLLYKEEKKLVRIENRLERFQQHIQKQQQKKALGGIGDPVDRWFWFWVFGWGLGLLLTILSGGLLTSGFLGVLWFVAFIGGSVSLVMWLVKKFG